MFLKDWFEDESEIIDDNYDFIKLNEIPGSRKKIRDKLLETIIYHYTEPNRVADYLNNEKFSELESLINNRLPTNSDYKKGDFGEIFGTEHLKQFENYKFPILRLRYKPKANRPMEGEDILGFIIENDEIIKIAIGESKVRQNSDSAVLNQARDELFNSYNPHPILLKFYSDHLYLINKDLSDKIERLMSKENLDKIEKTHWIFYITGFQPRKYNLDNSSKNLKNLTLVNIYLEDISDFIINLYHDVGRYYDKK